jgi:hypothetical protein
VDIIKILQLKPGVKSAGEGLAGFYVRGGGADQNLILVEKAPVYNPNHLLGFFSVFNTDAVKEVSLYKAGFPAQYAGRLSSVLDVKMNEGNTEKFTVKGGLGLISSRLTLESPIQKGKSSVTVSARRTYLNIFTDYLNKRNQDNPDWDKIPTYYFYDLNTKITFQPSRRDRLSLTGYFGDDIFKFNTSNFSARFFWGNRSATLKWDRQLNTKWFWSNAVFYSGYRYLISNASESNSISLGSNIRDFGGSSELDYEGKDRHKIRTGLSWIYHDFTVGDLGANTGFNDIQAGQRLFGSELGLFASDEIEISPSLKIYAGLHISGFVTAGRSYFGLEPRTSVRFNLTEKSAFKASYARMYQYLHLVSNSSASLPTDVWYPSTAGVKPQSSDQLALSYSQALWDNRLFFSTETYYKWMHNSIDFKDGAQLFANPKLENEFVFGKGWAYGAEWYLEKRKGRTTGWVGYTLSWTWRQFAEINGGEPLHPRYDRRHDISVVIVHRLSPRLSFSATWIYGTGNYTSLAVGRFGVQDVVGGTRVAPEFLGRNGYQMPPTHRMDWGLVWKLRPRYGETDLTFSLYNVYSRRNPFFIFYEENRNKATGEVLSFTSKLVSLFPIVPAVTYNFKF